MPHQRRVPRLRERRPSAHASHARAPAAPHRGTAYHILCRGAGDVRLEELKPDIRTDSRRGKRGATSAAQVGCRLDLQDAKPGRRARLLRATTRSSDCPRRTCEQGGVASKWGPLGSASHLLSTMTRLLHKARRDSFLPSTPQNNALNHRQANAFCGCQEFVQQPLTPPYIMASPARVIATTESRKASQL